MITYADASGPVTGVPGGPDHGACRVCMFHDAPTGGLMYRIEKEAAEPAPEAHLIAIHASAAYCRRLLAYIRSQEGGELGANGCLLLIRGAAQASDGEHTAGVPKDRPAGHPDPLRPTRYTPDGSPDWSGQPRPEDAITVPEG